MSDVWNVRHNKEARAQLKVVIKKMQTAGVPDADITTASAIRYAIKLAAEAK